MNINQTPIAGMHYINGEWIKGSGTAFESLNPATNACIWQGHYATTAEIEAACVAAKRAKLSWSTLSIASRIKYLEAFAEQIARQLDELVTLISKETGKPHWEATTEAQAVVAKIALAIKAYHERTPELTSHRVDNITHAIRYKPHGIMAIIGPFNFPAHLANAQMIPALLAGNTIVYKPSELTPAVAGFITQAWHTIGLPKGVLNCIQGNPESAKCLINQDIQVVAFTGSYKAGLAIHQQLAHRPEVVLALEMGGNNALIVDEISNQTAGVYQALLSSFITAGQRCSCARRVFTPDTAFGDEFLNKLINAASQLTLGAPNDSPQPFLGPVISPVHAHMHLESYQQLLALGGIPLLQMQQQSANSGFLSPGIIDVTHITSPPDEEIFAPLMQIKRYHSFEEAIDFANQTQYGLTSGLLSDNPSHYQQFYHQIKAGIVYWNLATTGTSTLLPFGGIGHSGNGRPAGYYVADYCAYPLAGQDNSHLSMPKNILPGITL